MVKKGPILGLIGLLGCNSSNEVFNNNNWYADYLESNGEEYYENEKDNLVEVLNREKLENFGIILVDMQPGFLYKIDYDNDDENHRKVFFWEFIDPKELEVEVGNQKRVLDVAVKYDVPVLVFEMKASLFGETIPELKEIIDRVPRHVYMSKFRNDGFERYGDNEEKPSAWLKENGVDSVYFMGVNTDACVYSSASSATEVYDLNIVSTKDVIATSECYDDCADAFKGFNLFLEKGAFGEDHRIFIDYLRKAF